MLKSVILTLLVISSVMAHEGHDHGDHAGHPGHDHPVASDEIAVKVYYESLCPDSVKFFKEQLTMSYYDSFHSYIDLDFIPFGPFGKSKQWYDNGTFHFQCHHGETECYGNIVQACAVKILQAKKDRVRVINCLMTSIGDPKTVKNDTYPLEKCLNQYELKPDILDACINGTDGLKFLSLMGNKTAEVTPRIESVPTVTVNGVVDKDAVSNLKTVVCKQLASKNLKMCSGAGTITASMLLIAIASSLRAFIFS